MMCRSLSALSVCIAFFANGIAAGQLTSDKPDSRRRGPRVIQTFNYEGVKITGGMHQKQITQIRDFYLSHLRPNDVLRGFRLKHKDWVPGKELGGAYSERPLSFGQWLGGFARLYRATGDEALRAWVLHVMDEWGQTISEDGAYGYENQKRSHYGYDKMVGGLVDVYEYLGDKEAVTYLDRITDWAVANLDRSNEYAIPTEWYTLSENLYRAYELTGDARYRDFGKVWEYTDFWQALRQGENIFHPLRLAKKHKSYHAYSHVNSLSGAAMAYSVSGEKRYLDTIVNGYDFLQQTQLFATGGFGPEESLIVPNGMPETLLGIRRGESNVDVRFHFETSCGSWAAFKLARYLMQFTGRAKYGDWIERLIYNGVGALVPMNDYGMIMYGSSYNIYGAQKSHSTVWFCCQGSLPQTVAEYHNLVYFRDDTNLYVNLFLPSSVEWEGPNGKVRFIQETGFPEDGKVNLRFASNHPSRFGLKFRVPQWSRGQIDVTFNGEEMKLETIPGEWATIERNWSPDDTLTLQFDLSPHGEPLPGYVSPVAVLCGPVVMVQATSPGANGHMPKSDRLRFPADYLEIQSKVRINPNRNIHTNQELRPFYSIDTGEYYRMYFERAGRREIRTQNLQFDGAWEIRDEGRYCDGMGNRFHTEFDGSALVWEGTRHGDAGIASITIDGEAVGQVDQYGFTEVFVPRMDQRIVPFRWSITGLSPGKHTIEVRVTGKKNASSRGTWINVSGLSSYP